MCCKNKVEFARKKGFLSEDIISGLLDLKSQKNDENIIIKKGFNIGNDLMLDLAVGVEPFSSENFIYEVRIKNLNDEILGRAQSDRVDHNMLYLNKEIRNRKGTNNQSIGIILRSAINILTDIQYEWSPKPDITWNIIKSGFNPISVKENEKIITSNVTEKVLNLLKTKKWHESHENIGETIRFEWDPPEAEKTIEYFRKKLKKVA